MVDRRPERRARRTHGGARASAPRSRAAQALAAVANAYRLVHGEGDACPSLICDRYDRWLVVQLMSAGLEAFRDRDRRRARRARSTGRYSRAQRRRRCAPRNSLPVGVELLRGDVPDEIEVQRTRRALSRRAAPRPEDRRVPRPARESRAHRRASRAAVRSTASAITGRSRCTSRDARTPSSRSTYRPTRSPAPPTTARATASRTSSSSKRTRSTTCASGRRPASASTRSCSTRRRSRRRAPALPAAIRGYKDINLRAMRLLAPGGLLFTASCSFHLTKPLFLEMLQDAAADSGRRIALRAITRTTARSPGSADDSGNGIPQGCAARSARLDSDRRSRHCSWQLGQKYVDRPACTMRSIVRSTATAGLALAIVDRQLATRAESV